MAGMRITLLRVRSFLVLAILLGLVAAPGALQAAPSPAAQAQPPAKDAVAGVRNFTKVDSTIACGGAVTLEAFEALKQAGYKSVVNLRGASEQGNDVEAAKKAAEAAGLRYFHLPFVPPTPDMAMLDEFLKLVVQPENQPMMLHCASGGRASMFWAVKRVMIDGWAVEKAMSEVPDLSKNVSQPSRALFLEYLKAHGKTRP
jgi:uncharacterized protein (TIGR01244 family)